MNNCSNRYHFTFVKISIAALLAGCFWAGQGQAATYTWTGALSSAADGTGNWNGLAGNFAASDFAYWNGTQPGALNLSLTGQAVMNPAAPGITLLVDSGQVSALTLNSSNGTATIRMNGIILNPGAALLRSATPAWRPPPTSHWAGAGRPPSRS